MPTSTGGTVSPTPAGPAGAVSASIQKAQEDYYKAFLAYNAVLGKSETNSPQVKAAYENLKAAKTNIKLIKHSREKGQ
mgnify:FL=1